MVKTRHSFDVEDSPAQFMSLRRICTRRSQNYESVPRFSSGDSNSDEESAHEKPRKVRPKKASARKRIRCVEDDSAEEELQTPELQMGPRSGRGRSIVNGDTYGGIRRSSRKRNPLYSTLNQSLIIDNAALGLVDYKEPMPAPSTTPTRSLRHYATRQKDKKFQEDGFSDMYSRVKRARKNYKKDMYGIPIPDQGEETEVSEEGDGDNTLEDGEEEENKDDDEEEHDDDDDETDIDSEHDKLPPRRSYFLREHKPRTQIYEAPPIGPQLRRPCKAPVIFQDSAPIQRKTRDHPMYRSPARRNSIRRKSAFHGSSSTSSDSSSSDDESRFQRRKAKSMTKARNRCLPMNLEKDDVAGLRKDRSRIGSSLADVDPMTVDRSITFESVGGLGKHVRALKEMVVFPLLYPEVFQKFKISPPRGVLFYGPPGTGKTLVARALANECSNDDRRVAFFMRKGADCLSKWVGESERQLRLLFDQAYQMRPSIIFFDEIDGLAPVRSSRQDQIHSSIVSTLLALMDGLDSRGEIVIIGATNRIDSIDPALRRPGRFDREFLFPLPSVQARQHILKINTKAWTPQLVDPFLKELAEKCVGYCGADLKALCTEAALLALRRRYPQIYTSTEKLQLDVSTINVSAKDFSNAMQVIVPTAQRSVTSPCRSLSKAVAPLLRVLLQDILSLLQTVFPCHLIAAAGVDTPAIEAGTDQTAVRLEELGSDDEDDAPCIFNQISGKHSKKNNNSPLQQNYFNFGLSSSKSPITHRPRLMLAGCPGQGQTAHLAPAVLHQLERLPVHILDLPALFACSAKSPEESCAQVFREARRTSPSIVYLPHVDQWWPVLTDTLQATFLTLLKDLDPSSPILMFATTDTSYLSLDRTLQELFDNRFGEVISMRNPSASERKEFFTDILLNQATKPPTRRKLAALRALEVLPKAAPPKERELTQAEMKKMEEQEEATNRELRLFLRDALNKIARDRKFNLFAKPVDIEEVTDYLDIVKTPMDLSTMMSKIDLRLYQSVKEFLADINLICTNALEYNPDKDPGDRAIRHRACALRDTAQSIVKNELDPDFEKLCEEMAQSRKRRGVEPPKSVPAFYFTTPLHKSDDKNVLYPSRFSKRARGMEAEDLPQYMDYKRARKSDEHSQSEKDDKNSPVKSEEEPAQTTPESQRPVPTEKNTSPVKKSVKKTKCVWNYTSRRRRRIQQAIRLHRSQNRAKIQKRESPVATKVTRESSPGSDENEVTFSKTSPSHPAQDITESDISQDVVMDETIEADSKIDQSVPVVNGTPTNTSIVSPAHSSLKHSDHKSPPAKRDLDFSDIKLLNTGPASATVLDSGLGSSMESNCESMDSVDQLKQQLPQTVQPSVEPPSVENLTEKDLTKESNTPKDTSIHETPPSQSKFHMTRSRSGNKDARHALEVLEEPDQPLVVDREKLESLLVDLVEGTHDYTVENLGKLYSMLSRCIFQHRQSYDKTQLVKDLESSIEVYTHGDRRLAEVPSTSMVVPSTSHIYNHRTDM